MISVGSPGSAGSVITDGSCGNGYPWLDRVVGVVVAVDVGVSLEDAVGASVVGVVVVCALDCEAGGVVVAALDGRVVVVAGVGAIGFCGGAPWTSWMMPQMISAIRTAMRMPHPDNAIGLRQPGIGSS
ncbi:MAG: hypothetical protein QOG23_5402, partial [Blastocatellia bacterium]|nr:hypothetical protein [Blastocatellia bacterium]